VNVDARVCPLHDSGVTQYSGPVGLK
jgi:hypothetical protein